MPDESFERLLRGYALPEPDPALDVRVQAAAEEWLVRADARRSFVHAARAVGDAFGFGYLNFLFDFATATDAEYDVEVA